MNAVKAAILPIERGRKGEVSKKEKIGNGRTTSHDVKRKVKVSRQRLTWNISLIVCSIQDIFRNFAMWRWVDLYAISMESTFSYKPKGAQSAPL